MNVSAAIRDKTIKAREEAGAEEGRRERGRGGGEAAAVVKTLTSRFDARAKVTSNGSGEFIRK